MVISVQNESKNQPDFKSAVHVKLAPAWKITGDLWGSPLDIRLLTTEYLPKFNKEPDAKYTDRKNNSVFENEFRLSIETMAGMVFRKDPAPDDVVPEIETLFTDIDQCGNSLWKFLLEAFEYYCRDGNGHIYIDAPPVSTTVEATLAAGQRPTKADRAGDKPYWVFYRACQVLKAQYEKKGSREILSQVTLEEKTVEPDGEFGEKDVTRIRRLNIGSYKVYEKAKDADAWMVIEEGSTGLDFIPFVSIADLASQPPLLTLALLNILYYNKTSDYDSICHLVCTPQQVRRYDSKADAEAAAALQVASPGVGIKGWGQHFQVTYVEVSGSGMDKAKERYIDVRQQMARIGVGMIAPSDMAAIRTATEVIDTAGTRQSKLARLAREFENAVEKALYITAQIINAIQGPKTINLEDAEQKAKLKLNIDYDRLTFNMEQLSFFSELVDSNKLSLETFLQWLDQVMDMPPGFDVKEELGKIGSQAPRTPNAAVEPAARPAELPAK